MENGAREVKGADLLVQLRSGLRGLALAVLDQLYPPCCAVCGTPLQEDDGLCAGCFSQLRPITAPLCPVLGLPFDVDLGDGALSAEALADPPPFGRARAAVAYGPVARHLVSRLKYGDRPELARLCGRLMVGAGAEVLRDRPLLVPVPLHPSRLRFRRFNQSMLLAQQLARLTGLSVDPHLVGRVPGRGVTEEVKPLASAPLRAP